MIADVCIHRDNPNNPHVHVMTTLREVTNDGFGKKNRKWNSKDLIEEWRKDWADATNECLLKMDLMNRLTIEVIKGGEGIYCLRFI